jgi:hypothetical protein
MVVVAERERDAMRHAALAELTCCCSIMQKTQTGDKQHILATAAAK